MIHGRKKICQKATYFKLPTLSGALDISEIVEVYGKKCLAAPRQQAVMMIHLLPWVNFSDAAVMCSVSVPDIEIPYHRNGQ